MIPSDLIDQAVDRATTPRPGNAHIRRSLSDAYYAAFHSFIMGSVRMHAPNLAAQRSMFKRCGHKLAKRIAVDVASAKHHPTLRLMLSGTSVHPNAVRFMDCFVTLYASRMAADYEPLAVCIDQYALALVWEAEQVMFAWNDAFRRSDASSRIVTNYAYNEIAKEKIANVGPPPLGMFDPATLLPP